MSKLKTHSGAKKRFKKLKSGLIKFSHAYRRHLLTKKTTKQKRKGRLSGYIFSGDMNNIKPLMPY